MKNNGFYHRDVKAENVSLHRYPSIHHTGQFTLADMGMQTQAKASKTYCGTERTQSEIGGCDSISFIHFIYALHRKRLSEMSLSSSGLRSFCFSSAALHLRLGPTFLHFTPTHGGSRLFALCSVQFRPLAVSAGGGRVCVLN
jgi:hypothetical protein